MSKTVNDHFPSGILDPVSFDLFKKSFIDAVLPVNKPCYKDNFIISPFADEERTKTEKKFTTYVFTINNYTDELLDQLNLSNMKASYILYGKETAPFTNTPHLQGYIVYNNRRSFKACRKLLHWWTAPAKGDFDANLKYCSKGGIVTELGNRPKGQGNRTDLENIRTRIEEGDRLMDIKADYCNYQQIKFAEALIKYYPHNRPDCKIYWIFGDSGVGKTRIAESLAEHADGPDEIWRSHTDGSWFDGYVGQKNIILNDYRKDFCKFSWLLRLFEEYKIQVPVKGGFVDYIPERIWITTTKSPIEMWANRTNEDIYQLIRRLHYIWYIPRRNKVDVLKDDDDNQWYTETFDNYKYTEHPFTEESNGFLEKVYIGSKPETENSNTVFKLKPGIVLDLKL